jgi:hypothetical protein
MNVTSTNPVSATLPNQIPMPPVDMQMPVMANNAYIVITYAIFLIVLILFIKEARKNRSPIPLLALLGGAVSFVLEPFFDIVALVWYPQYGQTPIFRAFNYSIPFWMLPAYALYMGAQGYWVSILFKKGLTSKALYVLFFAFWVTNAIVEMPGLALGIYTYYGDQPFRLFGFPLWMAMTNSVVPILIGVSLYSLERYFQGYRTLLVIPMIAMTIAAAEAALGFPVWLTLNSNAGLLATHIAALITLALSLATLGCIASFACSTNASGSYEQKTAT